MPERASEPLFSVSGTDRLVYHGPPESAADAPVGAAVSFVTVNVAVDVPPAPLVAVTVCEHECECLRHTFGCPEQALVTHSWLDRVPGGYPGCRE